MRRPKKAVQPPTGPKKTGGPPKWGPPAGGFQLSRLRSAEEREHGLRARVGQGQRLDGSLLEDLPASERRGFGREVGVTDLAFGRRSVLKGDTE